MRKIEKILFVLLLSLSLVFVACGDDDEDGDSSMTSSSGSDTSSSGTSSSGTDASSSGTDASSSGTDASSSGGDTMTPPDDTMMPPNDTMMPPNDTMMPPDDMMMGRIEANGCTFEGATDMTGNATVSITDISAWTIGHQVCVIVDAGTEVSWTGNFSFHPLAGGEVPTTNDMSPITTAGSGVTGDDTVSVTLSEPRDEPYFCTIHGASMQGVVYVNPAP